ncbi:cysteine desulfurase NifS [Candidatus Woesearchaeota archaeon]|nr:cysteine desulfurase NifS [Candidatus Woesearchaeota archaeon]MBW3006006.1 cysteine desulfurase NifS [Candidatus Woesearchaeota archaeon]
MKVYLDNAATTKTAPEVAEAMQPFFTEKYGNASSIHSFGEEAKDALENARQLIANYINAEPEQVIFTSGGTESDNIAIKGTAYALKKKGKHIITSKFEHPAVLECCQALEKEGFEVTYLGISKDGFVNAEELRKAIRDDTVLVTIMHANNEIGTIQDVEKIGKICGEKEIVFHTDAVQSLGKVPIDVKDFPVDLISFSSHKIHGPKGIGVLFVKNKKQLQPLLHGGAQEFSLRPGTENVSGAVGFAKAVDMLSETDVKRMTELRDYLIEKLLEIPEACLNGSRENRLCNNVNVSFSHIEGESILLGLDDKGVAVSTGSACTSKKLEPSHVLLALGIKPEEAHGSVRLSLSKYTTKEEIDYTINSIKEVVESLRKISPLGS